MQSLTSILARLDLSPDHALLPSAALRRKASSALNLEEGGGGGGGCGSGCPSESPTPPGGGAGGGGMGGSSGANSAASSKRNSCTCRKCSIFSLEDCEPKEVNSVIKYLKFRKVHYHESRRGDEENMSFECVDARVRSVCVCWGTLLNLSVLLRPGWCSYHQAGATSIVVGIGTRWEK